LALCSRPEEGGIRLPCKSDVRPTRGALYEGAEGGKIFPLRFGAERGETRGEPEQTSYRSKN